jgi:hypothetical protein
MARVLVRWFGIVVAGAMALACSSTSADGDDLDESADEVRASWSGCHADSDCVEVMKPDCCPSGTEFAVNKDHVSDWRQAHACDMRPPPLCLRGPIPDPRVAQCDADRDRCVMIAPEDIRCGGRTRIPHACPSGYTCDMTNVPVDAPGHCVKSTTTNDCRQTGCSSGRYCSACWGQFACIPNGSLC